MANFTLENVRIAGRANELVDVHVANGLIVSVGHQSRSDRTAPRLDCEGCVIAPGFIDGHSHPLSFHEPGEIDLAGCSGIEQVLALLKEEASRAASGEWIAAVGIGDGRNLREGRVPSTAELDAISDEHRIFVRCGTRAAVNSFLRDEIQARVPADGRPSAAGEMPLIADVWDAFDRMTPTQDPATLEARLSEMAACGITSIIDFGSSGYDLTFDRDLETYEALREERRLPMRCWVSYRVPVGADMRDIRDDLQARTTTPRREDDLLRIGPVKLVVDGGGFDGALRRTDYPGASGYRGVRFVDQDEIRILTEASIDGRWSMAVHAIGGAAMDDVIKTWAGFAPACSRLRFSIEHAFEPSPANMRQCRELELFVGIQQPLFYKYADAIGELWGMNAAEVSNPVRDWLRAGVRLVGGSDIPPRNPLFAMQGLCTRQTEAGTVVGSDQAIDAREALQIYTRGAAARLGEGSRLGEVLDGYCADLVLLTDDPTRLSRDRIGEVGVLATLVAGGPTFCSDEAPAALVDFLQDVQLV